MKRTVLLVALFLALLPQAFGGSVVLKKAWVNKYKDRATIDASFTVDHAHKRPNPAKNDGDMHVAGRSPQDVGLPMVAEVMNAAKPTAAQALTDIHSVEGQAKVVEVDGAWRLWFEHPADSQTQFANVPPAANTNPDHSFEIHPITKFGSDDLTQTFLPIPGFSPYDAEKAFGAYEKLTITVQSTSSAITLTAKKTGYNYVQFTMRLIGAPKKLDDGGYAVFADVMGADDDAIASKVRMIFVPGTPPCNQLVSQKLGDGDEMDVIGIPRVNLNAVWTFVSAAGTNGATRKLPYEMIIVATK
jgi:hypothetical protein